MEAFDAPADDRSHRSDSHASDDARRTPVLGVSPIRIRCTCPSLGASTQRQRAGTYARSTETPAHDMSPRVRCMEASRFLGVAVELHLDAPVIGLAGEALERPTRNISRFPS